MLGRPRTPKGRLELLVREQRPSLSRILIASQPWGTPGLSVETKISARAVARSGQCPTPISSFGTAKNDSAAALSKLIPCCGRTWLSHRRILVTMDTDRNEDGQDSARLVRRRKQNRDLAVRVEYVVVDGPDGEALRQRQASAIRQVLQWLADHPDGTEST
jgi:hypothetical protein